MKIYKVANETQKRFGQKPKVTSEGTGKGPFLLAKISQILKNIGLFNLQIPLFLSTSSQSTLSIGLEVMANAGGHISRASQGCLKCGQPGHWARDCTAPKDQWLPRQPKNVPGNENMPAGDNGVVEDAGAPR